jgi:uroporphyrinogen decarboxylase
VMTVTETNFDRLRRALFRQGEGDRVPLFELSIHKDIKAQIIGRAMLSNQDEVDFWRTAGYDFVSIRAGVRSVVRGLHPAVKEWRSSRLAPGEVPNQSGWVGDQSGLVLSRRDFVEFPWPLPEDLGGYNDYSSLDVYLRDLRECLPSDMKLVAQLGYLFMGAWQLMGFDNFCLKLADEPELVADVIGKLATSQMAVLELLLQDSHVGVIWMPDDLCYNSGPVVAPKVYQKYIYPWYRRIIERCHQAGIPIGLHSDGDLTRLLPDLVECGFDAIHPFEPPLNDIVAIKQKWGGRISVAGNIDLKATLCGGTPESVESEVRSKAQLLAPGGGWLLGSSNSIPEFVPIDNYRALLAAGLKYGRYGSARQSEAE